MRHVHCCDEVDSEPLDVETLMLAVRRHEHPHTEPVKVRDDHLMTGGYFNEDCGPAIAAEYDRLRSLDSNDADRR